MSGIITVTHTGDFSKTRMFLERIKKLNLRSIFDKYGRQGVEELQKATPKKTGKTAASWSYKVEYKKGEAIITWSNSNENNGEVIALLIQYGHGIKNGGYVKGQDYINPAMDKVYKNCLDDVWREVTK